MSFKKAVRKNIPAKIFIDGPSGSGKSKGALLIAKGLAGGGKFCALDSENKRLSMFADEFDFDVEDIQLNTPKAYIDVIKNAENSCYNALIIDSISPIWHWVIETADNSNSNGINAWNKPKTELKKLSKAIRDSSIHIVITCRSKEDYVIEESENRKGFKVQVPRKIGLAPDFEKNFAYEFAFCFSVDMEHKSICTKDVSGLTFENGQKITEDYGISIRKWLEEGLNIDDEYNMLYQSFNDSDMLKFLKYHSPDRHPESITPVVKKWLVEKHDSLYDSFQKWIEETGFKIATKNEEK